MNPKNPTTQPPLVSTITATYNMGHYVGLAIDSILAQNYPALEVIVIDDGSTDDTRNILSRYHNDSRVRIIHQENYGQTKAKNRGIKEALGKYIAFCDADDQWLPDKLSQQIPVLEAHNGYAVSYGDVLYVDSDDKELPTPEFKRYSGKITGPLLLDNFVTFNTTVLHRAIIEDIGAFDESLTMSIDYDLWLRVSLRYPFFYLPRPLVRYRVWEGQMSHRTDERFVNIFKVMNNFFANSPACLSAAEIRRGWAHTYVSRGRWHTVQKKHLPAMHDFARAFFYRPHDLRLWKNVARLMLGR